MEVNDDAKDAKRKDEASAKNATQDAVKKECAAKLAEKESANEYEIMMEKDYPGYKTMSYRQRKQNTPRHDYYDEDGDPFDPMNGANWDGDQQIGFRD